MLVSCDKHSIGLPAEKPLDLKIEYRVDGGMSDYKVNILVHHDSCTYYKRENGQIMNKVFVLSSDETNSIYNLLKKNNFDNISFNQEKGTVYDRGGITVSVSCDKKSIIVSDAQSNFVKEEWYEKWRMVTDGIDNIIRKKIEVI